MGPRWTASLALLIPIDLSAVAVVTGDVAPISGDHRVAEAELPVKGAVALEHGRPGDALHPELLLQ